MPFDVKAFKKAKCEARTSEVRADSQALADFFEEGEEPVFKVRGLMGEELARVREAADNNKNLSDVLTAISSSESSQEKIDHIRELLGVSTTLPNELVRRQDMLAYGSVEPDLDHEAAKLVAVRAPIDFYKITDEILRLTGDGYSLQKKKDSSGTQE